MGPSAVPPGSGSCFAATRAGMLALCAGRSGRGAFVAWMPLSVCVDDALDALCELTGENASERVIDQVFERFCVGE